MCVFAFLLPFVQLFLSSSNKKVEKPLLRVQPLVLFDVCCWCCPLLCKSASNFNKNWISYMANGFPQKIIFTKINDVTIACNTFAKGKYFDFSSWGNPQKFHKQNFNFKRRKTLRKFRVEMRKQTQSAQISSNKKIIPISLNRWSQFYFISGLWPIYDTLSLSLKLNWFHSVENHYFYLIKNLIVV